MRRTTEARIEGADAGFDAIEHSFAQPRSIDELLGDLQDGAVHREVVLSGGDDQVDGCQKAVLIDLVVMEQRAARGDRARRESR